MRYNLFKKEAADDWDKAKEKLIKSTTTARKVEEDYKLVFPYDYNKELHFVYEGELVGPYKIHEDLSIYFYNDRECLEKEYRELGIGEVLEGDDIVRIPSPGGYCEWIGDKWIYNKDIEINSLTLQIDQKEAEIEGTKAKLTSRKALGMFTEKIESEVSKLLSEHSDLCYDLSILAN